MQNNFFISKDTPQNLEKLRELIRSISKIEVFYILGLASDSKKQNFAVSNATLFLMSVCGFENIRELTDIMKEEWSAIRDFKGGKFCRDPFDYLMDDTSVAKKGFSHVLSTRNIEALEYFLKKSKNNYILLEISFKDVVALVKEFPKSLLVLKILLKYDLLMKS
jgi:hypothetical protein